LFRKIILPVLSLFLIHLCHAEVIYSVITADQISDYIGHDSIPKIWGTSETGLVPYEWKASWIWRRGESQGTNLLLLARKTFTVEKQPDQARLFISADNRYELYVNGKMVNRGPARCQPNHQSYDILEIGSLIRPGENVLAIRALHQGKFGSFFTPPRPGLMAQLEITTGGSVKIITTDSSWKVKKPEGTNLDSPPYGELIDFRRAENGWQNAEFDDDTWTNAEELTSDRYWPWPEPSRKAVPQTNTFPWTNLVARDLPYLKESIVMGKKLFETGEILEMGFNDPVSEGVHGLLFPLKKGSITGLESYQNGSGPVTIKNSYPADVFGGEAIYSTYLVFDLGELMHGYPHLEVEGNAGTIVEILYAPHLLGGKFPLRTDISGRALTDKIILGRGKNSWDALEIKYVRYMLIAIRNTDRPVNLYFAGFTRTDYPFAEKGYLSVPDDKEVEGLWKAGRKTLHAITTDAFTDNYREMLQYVQTSYYSSRASYATSGDSYLQRRYLKQVAELQQIDGILPAAAPVTTYKGQRFLDAPLFWVLGLHDYYLYTGDTSTVSDLLPAAGKVLERLREWENKDGLIDSPPYPYWIDHADLDRSGANFSLNALYLLALEDYTSMERWAGNLPVASAFEKRAEKLRLTLRNKFWNSDKKLFSEALTEGKLSETYSEQANSLAIVAGVATPEQQVEIVKEFVVNKSARLVPSVLFMHYITESLFISGHGIEALSMLKERYRGMMNEGSGTLWEDWSLSATKKSGTYQPNSSRSVVQAENTFITHSLTRWLLGMQPVKPGMKEVILSYNPCGLAEIKGAIPSPYGLISIAWGETKKGKTLEVEIPEGINVSLDMMSLDLKKNLILLDGGNVSVDLKKLKIPGGKHTLEFQ